jgi:cytidine deaminase
MICALLQAYSGGYSETERITHGADAGCSECALCTDVLGEFHSENTSDILSFVRSSNGEADKVALSVVMNVPGYW